MIGERLEVELGGSGGVADKDDGGGAVDIGEGVDILVVHLLGWHEDDVESVTSIEELGETFTAAVVTARRCARAQLDGEGATPLNVAVDH